METPKLAVLRQAMQAYTMRTQALAENIAHLDTPDYQRRTVNFEEVLQSYRRSDHRDPARLEPRVELSEMPPHLEDELMDMADTQMRTQLVTRALSGYFGTLRTGITGRTA